MFNEINILINNDVKNYNKRSLTKSAIDYDELCTIKSYIAMWSNDESKCKEALSMAIRLDQKLHDRIQAITGYGIWIPIYEDLLHGLYELLCIDEELTHEEQDNLGFGPRARKLRKMWRGKLKELNKMLDKTVKNRINFIKEWSKSRTTYVMNDTGEVHNGLYWTIRDSLTMPKVLMHGFKKESK
jgi:hypothetical protein